MPRIAGGLGGTRHCQVSRVKALENKRGFAQGTGAVAIEGKVRFNIRPQASPTSEKAMAQTIREKAKIRQAREEGRLTEDEIARAHLGEGEASDGSKMTPDSALQTPSPLDPGHTA